ncbi:MAG: winged helix-turn-helix domain-containing protein [Lachnospiraceae bacterium]|nr:winged helix-turn-helix domain-containing protein [Lachnospiraceae bacterium]
MRKIYTVSIEEANEIAKIRKTVKEKNTDKRLYAVELRGRGKKNQEIAEKLDTSTKVVSHWVSVFKNQGIEGLLGKKKGGHNWNISYEEEEKILEKFEEKAKKGHIVEISEIRKAYEEKVGRKTAPTQIYAVLHRHNWTKKMPRSKHPKKASEEAIEASKKLTLP